MTEATASAPIGRRRWYQRRPGRFMLVVFATLFVAVLLLLVTLLWMSPGRPAPFLDEAGRPLENSLSEKNKNVDINGVRQGMFIKSKDTRHPILLYVHGGMPDYFLSQEHPTQLEDAFTVVWWEQRGAGISYSPDIPRETMTVEQLIADVIAVTRYLRKRFGQDKVYLMAHSGGTFIAIQAAARAPELFHAYIGIAQISHQHESERLAYAYMLERFREEGDREMVEKLEAAPVTQTGDLPPGYIAIRDQAMHRLGVGTMHEMRSLVTGLLLPSFRFREYTLAEKLSLWRAKSQSGVSIVWDEIVETDLRQRVTELDVPVYFFHGRHDYTVNHALAQSYFARIRAPLKGFYTFEESAHSPNFEEPERMNRILREDVLAGRHDLADEMPR